MADDHERFLREAIALSEQAARGDRGGPFGALVVRDGEVLGRGINRVLADRDPTAHAEVVALREACRAVGSHALPGAVLYASCEPCPLCLAAALWARVGRIVFAAGRDDAAAIGFDDARFHALLAGSPGAGLPPTEQRLREAALGALATWAAREDRVPY